MASDPSLDGVPAIAPSHGGVRVDRVITSGTFELDGGSWEVDNNVWVIGDERECIVIDAAHDAEAILSVVDGRTVRTREGALAVPSVATLVDVRGADTLRVTIDVEAVLQP